MRGRHRGQHRNTLILLVGRAGIEPATNWLKAAFRTLIKKHFLFSVQ